MRSCTLFVIVLTFAIATVPGVAQAVAITTPRDSADFNYLYTGADLVGSDWGTYGTPNGTVEGSLLRFTPADPSGSYTWNHSLVNGTGWTAEITYQITQPEPAHSVFSMLTGDSGSNQYNVVNFGAGQILYGETSENDTILATANFQNRYHKLRIAEPAGGGSGDTHFWVDDRLVANNLSGLSYTLSRFWIGKQTGGQTAGEVLIKSVRVDTTDAFAPPPPTGMVTNMTTGEMLFSDDFEQPSGGVSHAPMPDGSGDYDPSHPWNPGYWSVEGGASELTTVQVADYSPPGAYQGHNYLRLGRLSGEHGTVNAWLSEPQTMVGDLIHLETMVYIDDANATPQIVAYGTDGVRFNILGNYGAAAGSTQLLSYPNLIPGINYATGIWQKWEVDYVLGANNFRLTISDDTYYASVGGIGLGAYGPGNGSLARFFFNQDKPGSWMFMDAVTGTPVPEPASLALLLLGSGLLALVWRRRR